MRRHILLPLALLLAACQATATGSPGPRASRAPAKAASARPAAKASPAAKPGATSPSPAAATAVAALDLLKAPPGAAERLAGTLRVDAAYLVAAGAGNVLSHNGAAIVAAGAGNIVAAGGGNMVAAGAGNLVAAGAGNIVAAGGGNIVAAGGGNIVAAGGGNLVAAGAGNMVAAGAGNYALRQASPSTPAIRAGEQLPAAGMLVSVVSLTTRKYLPMGVDGKGQPVYAVLTDAQGRYEAFVAPGGDPNVLVVANVPGRRDARLIYNTFLDRAAEGARDVDEDSAAGARYLRRCFVGRLTQILMATDTDAMLTIATNDPNLNEVVKPLIAPMFERFRALAAAKGLGPGSEEKVVRAFAREVVDATLATMDLDDIAIDPLTASQWTGPPDAKALPILGKVMNTLRERATTYLTSPTDASRYAPDRVPATFLLDVNDSALGAVKTPLLDPGRKIAKPTDFADFVIEEYLAVTRTQVYRPIFNLLTWLQTDDPAERDALLPANVAIAKELESASSSIVTAVIRALAEDPTSPAATSAPSRAAEAAARAFDAARAQAEDQREEGP